MSQPNPSRKRDAKKVLKSKSDKEISQNILKNQEVITEKVKTARKSTYQGKSKGGNKATITREETKGGSSEEASAQKLTQAESKEGSFEKGGD